METLFAAVAGRPGMLRVPGLPFRHAFSWIQPAWFGDADDAAARLLALYRDLLAAAGLPPGQEPGARQAGPYNLVGTRRWMLLVPRSREHFDSVSVNSLGYAGSMFVRDEVQRGVLKRAGPMAVLKAVALPI